MILFLFPIQLLLLPPAPLILFLDPDEYVDDLDEDEFVGVKKSKEQKPKIIEGER